MEAGRSFKTMFSGQKDKNWLNNLTVGNKNDQVNDGQKIHLMNSENNKMEDVEDSQFKSDQNSDLTSQNSEITEVVEVNKTSLNSDMSIQSLTFQLNEKIKELQVIEAIRNDEIIKSTEAKNQIQRLENENQNLLDQVASLEEQKTELLKATELKIQEMECLINDKENELKNLRIIHDSDEKKEDDENMVEEVLEVETETITSAMAENGRLAMLNHELETKLAQCEDEKNNAELLYQELRSLMVAIGVEHNLNVFDQQKIELAKKTNVINQLENLLSERDDYITKIQNSLMDGIGQMFQQRPTGLLKPAVSTEQINDEFENHSNKALNDQVEEKSSRVIKTESQDQWDVYYKRIDENWGKIKIEAKKYLSQDFSMEDVAKEMDISIVDLGVIVNSKTKQMKKITGPDMTSRTAVREVS